MISQPLGCEKLFGISILARKDSLSLEADRTHLDRQRTSRHISIRRLGDLSNCQTVVHPHCHSFHYPPMHSACLKSIQHVLPGKVPGKALEHPHGYTTAGIESPSRKYPLHFKVFYRPQSILIVHLQITPHLEKQQSPEP